jgi:GAF domain-containing protein
MVDDRSQRPRDHALNTVGESAVQGQFAFPMVSRGSLVGVLVCGAKNDDEVFAPDESDALATLAHRVGVALGALSTANEDGSESIRRTQELILDELRDLPNKLIAQSRLPRLDVQGGNR